MACFRGVADSSDGPIAGSFAQFDLQGFEKLQLYNTLPTPRERPIVFTDKKSVDMWKSSPSVLINTTKPTSLLRAEVGSNQECVKMIEKKYFPSEMKQYIRWTTPSKEVVYVSIIVSDNGEGTPHRTHVVVSPYMVDGYESQIFAKKAGRRVSSWIHYSHQGLLPPPPAKNFPRRNYQEVMEKKPWLLNRPTPEATDQSAASSSSSTSREPDLVARALSLSSTAVDKARKLGRELVDTVVETAVETIRSRSRSPSE